MNDPGEELLADLRADPDPRDPRAASLLRGAGGAPGRSGWALLGLPYDGGIPSRPGARLGPRAVREALPSFSSFAGDLEVGAVLDLGDVALPSMDGAAAHGRIEEASRRVFAAGLRPVFLGGDHGCTGSVIRGLAAAKPGARLALISVDAHLDVREYEGPGSLSSGTPFRRALETGILEGERTAMIGIRRFANSRYFLDWAAAKEVRLFPLETVAARGAREVARAALEAVGEGADSLYLSIDLDAADVSVAPGVSAVGVGGLSAREMIELVATVASDPRLVGADIMELSPPYDPDGRTAKLAGRLLLEILAAGSEAPGC